MTYTISDAITLKNIDDQMYMLMTNIENITFYILSFFLCCVILILYFIPKKQSKRYFTLFVFGCFLAQRAIVFINTDDTAQSKTLSLKHEALFTKDMNDLKSSVGEMQQLIRMSVGTLQEITDGVAKSVTSQKLKFQEQFQKDDGKQILTLVSQNKDLVYKINETSENLFKNFNKLLTDRSKLVPSAQRKRQAKIPEVSVAIDNIFPDSKITVYKKDSKRQEYIKLVEKKDLHALSRSLTFLGSMIDIASSTNSEIVQLLKELPKNYSSRNKIRMYINDSIREVQVKNKALELQFLQVIKPYLLKIGSYTPVASVMAPFISSDISVSNLKYLASIFLPKFDVNKFDLDYEVTMNKNFNVPIMSTMLVYLCTYNAETMAILVGLQSMWFIKEKFYVYQKPTIQQLTPQQYMKQMKAIKSS